MALTKITNDGVDFSGTTDFNVDNGTLVVDASTNRVGIGTASPNAELHVSDTSGDAEIRMTASSSSGSCILRFGNAADQELASIRTTSGTDQLAFFGFNDVERMRIDSSGRVGIGTSSPTTLTNFVLNSSQAYSSSAELGTTSNITRLHNTNGTDNTGVNNYASLQFLVANGATSTGAINYVRTGNNQGAFTFHQRTGASSYAEHMRLDASGRLGIGTTSPGSYVGGGNNFVVAQSGDAGLTIATGTSSTGTINFADGTSGDTRYRGRIEYNHTNDALDILTAATTRMRIDSSGRLLVGTSTSRTTWKGDGVNNLVQIEYAGTGYGPGLSLYANSATSTRSSILTLGKSGGTTVGSFTLAPANEPIGRIHFEGADGTQSVAAATIEAYVDGTPGANDMPGRLVFSTTADGASSPTERLRINKSGILYSVPTYTTTTSTAANVNVRSDGALLRSTSSIKYKTSVETLQDKYADALLNCRPVWYKSTSQSDNPAHSFWGFIAEEVAEIDPRLVHWKTTEPVVQENGDLKHVPCEPEPEGVAYDRFVPHLLNLIKRQQQAIETLEAKVAALESA